MKIYPVHLSVGHVALCCLLSLIWSLPAADISGTITSDTAVVDGDTWTAGSLTIATGVTLTVPAGATLTFDSAANQDLNGSGTLLIDATGRFLHNTDTAGDNLIVRDSGAIINNGTYQFATGGDIQLFNNGSSFANAGVLTKTGKDLTTPFSNDPSYIFRTASGGGSFINTGTISVLDGHLNIAGGASTSGNFTTSGSGLLSFSGQWTELTGVADDSGGGVIRTSAEDPAATTGAKFTAAAATTVLNVTGTGLVLGTGTIDLNGNLLRNDGGLRVSAGLAPVIFDDSLGGGFC